jgi:hypothetical protein
LTIIVEFLMDKPFFTLRNFLLLLLSALIVLPG